MARTGTFPLYDRIMEGKLSALLTEWRAEGASYQEVAHRLRDHDINVSHETVRRWILDHLSPVEDGAA